MSVAAAPRWWGDLRKNDIGLQCDQLPRDPLHRLHVGPSPASVEPYVVALHPPELLQSLSKCRDPGLCFRVVLSIEHQHADAPHPLGLLRARRDRPRRSAAEQRDELAPSHSITSSARASSVGGTSRPSALAVLRLRTSSIFTACSTGRSAGLTPLRIFPVEMPTR